MNKFTAKHLTGALALAFCATTAHATFFPFFKPAPPFEVWTIDQSRTDHDNRDGDANNNRADGGKVYIFDGKWIGGINAQPSAIVDLVDLISNPDTNESGNFNVGQRPHIGGTNFGKTHMTLSWFAPTVGSAEGGISIFRLSDRKVVWQYYGLGQLHMPGPSPDDRQLAGVSIGDQKLHIFRTDYATETFELASTTSLNTVPGLLAGLGTSAAAPICSNYTPDSKHLFVTFRDGGLAIFNVENPGAPFLTEVYPATLIAKEGCGLIQHPDGKRMFTGSGAAESGSDATFGNIEYMHVWNMQTVGNGQNDDLIASIDLGVGNTFANGTANPRPSWGDNHGPMYVFGGRYLWVTMRIDNEYRVIDTVTNRVVSTVNIANQSIKTGKGRTAQTVALTKANPMPDVLDRDPINPLILYASLRGPCPLSGAARFIDNATAGEAGCETKPVNFIEAPGRTPGQAVIRLGLDGKSGKVVSTYPIANVVTKSAAGAELTAPTNITDPHAGKVVVRSPFLPPQ